LISFEENSITLNTKPSKFLFRYTFTNQKIEKRSNNICGSNNKKIKDLREYRKDNNDKNTYTLTTKPF